MVKPLPRVILVFFVWACPVECAKKQKLPKEAKKGSKKDASSCEEPYEAVVEDVCAYPYQHTSHPQQVYNLTLGEHPYIAHPEAVFDAFGKLGEIENYEDIPSQVKHDFKPLLDEVKYQLVLTGYQVDDREALDRQVLEAWLKKPTHAETCTHLRNDDGSDTSVGASRALVDFDQQRELGSADCLISNGLYLLEDFVSLITNFLGVGIPTIGRVRWIATTFVLPCVNDVLKSFTDPNTDITDIVLAIAKAFFSCVSLQQFANALEKDKHWWEIVLDIAKILVSLSIFVVCAPCNVARLFIGSALVLVSMSRHLISLVTCTPPPEASSLTCQCERAFCPDSKFHCWLGDADNAVHPDGEYRGQVWIDYPENNPNYFNDYYCRSGNCINTNKVTFDMGSTSIHYSDVCPSDPYQISGTLCYTPVDQKDEGCYY